MEEALLYTVTFRYVRCYNQLGVPINNHLRKCSVVYCNVYSIIQVKVDVGTVSNQKPEFSQQLYEAYVDENAEIGASVIKVKATDPDGPDNKIIYSIHSGAKDNFVIGPKTGIISVAPESNLDIQTNGGQYTIKIRAEDIGKPFNR